jgi:hypothetical protein
MANENAATGGEPAGRGDGAGPGDLHGQRETARHGGAGRNVADPVTVPPSGRTEFGPSPVAADQLEMDLLAWAPDATARPVSVRLPTMTIGPGTA